MTKEEKELITRLNSGLLDGQVGDDLKTSGGSYVWKVIRQGVPMMIKQGPTKKFFNNRETEKIPGIIHCLEKWTTDEERLAFLQKFGWLMADEAVRKYSAKFKPKK